MPLVETTILGPKDSRKGIALIDSGAQCCLINIEFADKIGVNLENSPIINFHGVAGTKSVKPAHMAKVAVQVEGMPEKFEVEAGFIESDAVSIILGQQDFFDANRIKFEKDHNIFEINPVRKK